MCVMIDGPYTLVCLKVSGQILVQFYAVMFLDGSKSQIKMTLKAKIGNNAQGGALLDTVYIKKTACLDICQHRIRKKLWNSLSDNNKSASSLKRFDDD